MKKDYTLRPFRPDDFRLLSQLILSLKEELGPQFNWDIDKLGPTPETTHVLVATESEAIWGFFQTLRTGPDTTEILAFALGKEYRGLGLAGKFMSKIKELTAGGQILLEVHNQNARAIRFYEKMGFGLLGRRARYYPDGGEALLYEFNQARSAP